MHQYSKNGKLSAEETLRMRIDGDWIQTYTGKKFWPADPRPEDIDIEDIAHALSNLCRFTGHCREFYSVAQHCVIVSENVPPEHAMVGLLHDASEAYLLDIARPVKRLPEMGAYREMEKRLEKMLCERFALPFPFPPEVMEADARVLMTEKRDLLGPSPDGKWGYPVEPYEDQIIAWSPKKAEGEFLTRFAFLNRRRFR